MEDKLRPIINVAGDYVEKKEVQYEIGNVENGGIGIQIINGNPSPQSSATQHNQQAEEVEDNVSDTTEQQPTVQYSQYLIRGANPLKSDDEVQRNFVNAAKSGPSALVDYLLTAEGKLSFNVFAIKPSVFINTVNKECGTNISVKSYETAKYRRM